MVKSQAILAWKIFNYYKGSIIELITFLKKVSLSEIIPNLEMFLLPKVRAVSISHDLEHH